MESDFVPLILNASFLGCPKYISMLVKSALHGNTHALLDDRLHLEFFMKEAVKELHHVDCKTAFKVLAHWSRYDMETRSILFCLMNQRTRSDLQMQAQSSPRSCRHLLRVAKAESRIRFYGVVDGMSEIGPGSTR